MPAVTAGWCPKLRDRSTSLNRASSWWNRRIMSRDASRLPSLTSTTSHSSPALSNASVSRRRSSGRFSCSLKMGTTTETIHRSLAEDAGEDEIASKPRHGRLNLPPQLEHQQRVQPLRVIDPRLFVLV